MRRTRRPDPRRPRARPIVPAFIGPGDPVAVAAPSGVVDPHRLAAGVAYLRERGHPVSIAAGVSARHGYLAGPDAARAASLNDVIASREAGAILFARGGYGITRILDDVDLAGLRRRPRLLLGYSDVTALFMALQAKGPYLAAYGPLVSELGDPAAFDEASLWAALYGRGDGWSIPFDAGDVLRAGRGRGVVLGGCLSLLVTLLGTPHDPDYGDAILFWEEVGEEPYRIDRMLTQLRNAGKFDRLRGMVVGSLEGCVPQPGRASLELRDIIMELARGSRFPIVWNVRAGHIAGKRTIVLGAPAVLDAAARTLKYVAAGRGRLAPRG